MNLFYPSHDIALGNGVKHFNPPKAAYKLQEDLASLSDIWNQDRACTLPWGWDYDTRAFLNKEYGVKMRDLPSDDDLYALRSLSSRATTIDILSRLKAESKYFYFLQNPILINTEESLLAFIESNHNYVLKTPWSSSGRGLSRSEVMVRDTIVKHASSTIKKMGCIVAEPWYKKALDFAMLFYVGKKDVSFIGYSLFDNDETGTYRSGRLLSNNGIENELSKYIDYNLLSSTKEQLYSILRCLFSRFFDKPWEVGFIGIDMMIVEDDNEMKLHPCVEMNLRCTMGVVARLFFDKNMAHDESGNYFITPAMSTNELSKLDNYLAEKHKNNYRRLTTIIDDSMFMAYAIIDKKEINNTHFE